MGTKVKEWIEEIISNQVNEQLEMKKIEKELLKKVHSARLSMEREVKKEIDSMRERRREEDRKRKEEHEAYMLEAQQKMEDEKKKIAEERLAILGEQERIDKELRKQKKREEKKEKEEQMKILGKGNARPKLSFSLKPTPDGQL